MPRIGLYAITNVATESEDARAGRRRVHQRQVAWGKAGISSLTTTNGGDYLATTCMLSKVWVIWQIVRIYQQKQQSRRAGLSRPAAAA